MESQTQDFKLLQDDDKRYFPRWEVNSPVLYHLDGEKEFYEGQTRDLSCAGACIVGNEQFKPDQKIKLSIELTGGKKIQLNAHILWAKTENNQPQMGITFYNTSDEVLDTILQYAFELDKKGAMKQWFKGWKNS